ncbi:hypothetical protein J7F03_27830 [Streptomyces sp. ISL-43]|uniref:hypothetical protein n=1 Tax=Streptomyces sp. ISL-43 TaxID=2819183 RepID=UPI001BEC5A11|nr:hypothetical protein [Streptomyces sp. ISL-43]MBT2450815.1 hypothetical protein [Streptomyces sp. ISL-43]
MTTTPFARTAIALAFSAALMGLSAQAAPAAAPAESRAPLGTCHGCWPNGAIVAMRSGWGQDFADGEADGSTDNVRHADAVLGDGVWL